MLEEKDNELIQIRASGMSDLLKVVIQQFQDYCLDARHLKLKYKETLTAEIVNKECPENKSRSIISQAFTAMVIEAFYFDYKYGKESKSKAEIWSKQSPLKQFEQLSENYLNIKDAKCTDLYKKLSDLNKLRKRWVHNQSSPIGNYKKT